MKKKGAFRILPAFVLTLAVLFTCFPLSASAATISGDLSIRAMSAKNDTPHQTFVRGEDFYYQVMGGLLGSSGMTNPAYLVTLPDGIVFNPANGDSGSVYGVTDVTRGSFTLTEGTRIMNWDANPMAEDTGYSLRYYDKNMCLLTAGSDDLTKARYILLCLNEALSGNQAVKFRVGVNAETLGAPTQSFDASALLFDNFSASMLGESVSLNAGGRGTGDWPDESALGGSGNSFDSFKKYYNDSGAEKPTNADLNDYYMLQSANTVSTCAAWKTLDLTKTGKAIGDDNSPTTGPLRLGFYMEYTVEVALASADSNLSTEANELEPYKLTQIVDILPPGQKYIPNSCKLTVGGTESASPDVVLQDVPITINGRTLAAQRIVFTFSSPVEMPYTVSSTAKLEYSAILADLSLMPESAYNYEWYNFASIYVDSTDVLPGSKVSAGYGANGHSRMAGHDTGDAPWWNWGDLAQNQNIDRYEARTHVKHQRSRIASGVQIELSGSPPNPDIDSAPGNNTSVKWTIRVNNALTGEESLQGYWVVNVLPSRMSLCTDPVGYGNQPLSTGTYINAAGRQVIYWYFPNPLAPGEFKNIFYELIADENAGGP